MKLDLVGQLSSDKLGGQEVQFLSEFMFFTLAFSVVHIIDELISDSQF